MSVALLVPGFDPTTLLPVTGACGQAKEISAADLLAMFVNAYPAANVAWIWYSNVQPDVIATPALAGFIWFNPDNNEQRKYNGSSWVLLGYASQSINGNAIIDNTLAAKALNIPVGTALKILQVNAAGTDWQFVFAADALTTGSVAINKLIAGPSGTWLSAGPTGLSWQAIGTSYILAQLGVGVLDPTVLASGPIGFVLTIDSFGLPAWMATGAAGSLPSMTGNAGKWLTTDGTIAIWQSLPSSGILPAAISPGTNGQVLMTVAGVAAWANLSVLLGSSTSAALPIPATVNPWYPSAAPWTADIIWPHGLTAKPTRVSVNFLCKVSYGSYTANQSTVPVGQPTALGTFGQTPFFVWWDNTNVYWKRAILTGYSGTLIDGNNILEGGGFALRDRWDVQISAQV